MPEDLDISKFFPEEPDHTPVQDSMQGLALSQFEMVEQFVAAGFPRVEALYMVAATYSGNPGFAPDVNGD